MPPVKMMASAPPIDASIRSNVLPRPVAEYLDRQAHPPVVVIFQLVPKNPHVVGQAQMPSSPDWVSSMASTP